MLCFACIQLIGQDEQAHSSKSKFNKELYPNIHHQIWRISDYYESGDVTNYERLLEEIRVVKREDGKLKFCIETNLSYELDVTRFDYLNFELGQVSDKLCNIYIFPDELPDLFNKLKQEHNLTYGMYHSSNQGPSVMNSDSYNVSTNADGSGRDIAIFDSGFSSLTAAANAGATPSIAAMTTYTHGNGTLQSGGTHGTRCLETVYDHADGADYFLHKLSTTADLQDAVDDCDTDNVDIISHSLSWFNTAWDDNDGSVSDAFADANASSIITFTSAGNYADDEHDRQLTWVDNDNDDWFNWTSTDEGNSFTVPAGCAFNVYLSWGDDPDFLNDDYDLFLYSSSGTELTSSENANSYEALSWTNSSSSSQSYYVSVFNDGTDTNPFKLFFAGNCGTSLQYATAVNSMAHPAVCTHSRLLTIGAVDRNLYNQTSTDPIINYSSQGPSTNGSIKPELVGPTNTSTFTNSGAFTGTSCATPNAAGAAACLWSAHSGTTSQNMVYLMFKKADIFLDWGASGNDNVYGYGGLFLYDYSSDNVYVDSARGVDNTAPTGGVYPWDNLEDYQNLGPVDRRVIFLTNDLISAPETFDSQMFLTTLGKGTGARIIE